VPEAFKPLLSVIVASRGHMGALWHSAPPLLADERVEYILVDSGRDECPGHVARAYWPAAKVVDLPGRHPVDPGRAVRAAGRVATAPWLAALGPEVIVSERFLPVVLALRADGVFLTAEVGDEPVVVCSREALARAAPEEGAFGEALCRRLAALGFNRVQLPPRLFLGAEEQCRRQVPLVPPGVGLRPEVRFPDPLTIGIAGPALGDALKTVFYACWARDTFGVDVSLYPNWHGFRGKDFTPETRFRKESLVREILDLLDLTRPLPVVTDAAIDEVFVPDQQPWHFPLTIAARVRWRGWGRTLHRRVVYQLDGVSRAGEKNPLPGDLPRLLEFAPGFEMVPVGKHLSLRQCADAAAASDLFFGVDSGMLQLCYAVGVPVFLIGYRMSPEVLFAWHGDRHAVYCADTADFVAKARLFLGLSGQRKEAV
jgi:hypothetical protein